MLWSDSFNTGMPMIDRQHQRIVDYINRLIDAHLGAAPAEEIKHLFEDLVDYTLTHFTFEETLLANNNPRSLRAHKQIHATFSEKVAVLRSRFDRHGGLTLELYTLLTAWLTDHIQREDMRDLSPKSARAAIAA